jgi:outer membrane protein assembly factor BamD
MTLFCKVQLRRVLVIILLVGIALVAGVQTNMAQPEPPVSRRTQEISPRQDSGLFEQAVSQLRLNHPEAARRLFTALVEKYPDSIYLSFAKLAIADSFFQEDSSHSIAKAHEKYVDWLTNFPDDPLADFVMLKLADTSIELYRRANRGGIEARAERELKALLKRFPDTPLRPQVEERLRKVQEELAMHNLKVALFYLKERLAVAGAQIRLLVIATDYPHFSQMAQALLLLAKTYQDEADTAEAIKYYQQLICQFPDSQFSKEASDRLQAMGSEAAKDCGLRNDR